MVHLIIETIGKVFLFLFVIVGIVKLKKSKNKNIKQFIIKLISIICVFSLAYFSSIIITENVSYSNPSDFLYWRYGERDMDIIEDDGVFIAVDYFQRTIFKKTEESYKNLKVNSLSGEDILINKKGQQVVLSTMADYVRALNKTYVFICCDANTFFNMNADIAYAGKKCDYTLISDGKYVSFYFQISGKATSVEIDICGMSKQINFSKLNVNTIMKLNTIKIEIE